jgi:hypothetical protein
MTVVAFRDGTMAADTRLSDYNSASRASKLIRLQDGGVAGGCGLWSAAYAGLKWLAEGGSLDGSEDKRVLPDIDGAVILIARPDGSLWLLENRFPAFPLIDRTAVIGCGAEAAKLALALGKSAPEAVALVTKQDLLCGGPVQSLKVEPTHEYAKLTTHPVRTPPKKKRGK